MKINDYKLEINTLGNGDLYALRNGDKIFVDTIEIKGKNAAQVDQLIKDTLQKHQMEIVSVEETIFEKEDLIDRKSDLYLIRKSMRKILKNLGNDKISIEDKKDTLDIYETMCKASSVATKACIVELAYDKFEKEISDND